MALGVGSQHPGFPRTSSGLFAARQVTRISSEGTGHTGSLDACLEPSLGSLALTLQLVAGLSREQSSLGEKFWGHDIPVQLCQPAWAAQALPARCGFQTMGSPDPGDHQSAWPERG